MHLAYPMGLGLQLCQGVSHIAFQHGSRVSCRHTIVKTVDEKLVVEQRSMTCQRTYGQDTEVPPSMAICFITVHRQRDYPI